MNLKIFPYKLAPSNLVEAGSVYTVSVVDMVVSSIFIFLIQNLVCCLTLSSILYHIIRRRDI
jgi:hypothetical protein